MSTHLTALIFVITGSALIPLGDGMAKLAHEEFGAPMIFMAWTRFGLAAIVFAPIALATGPKLGVFFHPLAVMRGLLIVTGVSLILQGGARAPLADVFGAFFIAPIVSFVLAVVLLKERAGPMRWAMNILGFAGVVLIVKPWGGISTGLLFALAAGGFYGLFLTANRFLAGRFEPIQLIWMQLIVGGVVLAPLALPLPDLEWNLLLSLLVLGSAITSTTANLLIILAYKRVEATRLAPLIYVQLIGATVYGVWLFDAWPDPWALAGLFLLIASGAAGFLPRLR